MLIIDSQIPRVSASQPITSSRSKWPDLLLLPGGCVRRGRGTGRQPGTRCGHATESSLCQLQPELNDSWRAYRRAVELYSLRILTHQRDALDAFTGMLNKLSESRSLEGLPAALFDRALLWQPRNRLGPRNGFSSWSWVAC
jgi:hypothetical protein